MCVATDAASAASKVRSGADAGCLTLRFKDGSAFTMHPLWLRERCRSPVSVQTSTRQRRFEISSLMRRAESEAAEASAVGAGAAAAGAPRCDRVNVVGASLRPRGRDGGDDVEVRFSDGHVSVFDAQELKAEATDPGAWGDAAGGYWLPRTIEWDRAAFTATPFFDHDMCLTDMGMHAMLTQLHSHGAVIVRGVPAEPGAVDTFGSRVGPLRRSNWGTVFEVRATQAGDGAGSTKGGAGAGGGGSGSGSDSDSDSDAVDLADLAYTNEPLALHVDNPYRDPVPGYQLLHCIVAAAVGGESLIVDGWRAASRLRATEPELFLALCGVKSRFVYESPETTLVTFKHVISTQPPRGAPPGTSSDPLTDPVSSVVYSSRLDFAPMASPAELDTYYEARAAFHALLHEEESMFEFKLNAGDLLIVDNTRVLHGRRGFDTTATPDETRARWVQGCYFDRDATTSKYWTLSRRLARRLITGRNQPACVAAEVAGGL